MGAGSVEIQKTRKIQEDREKEFIPSNVGIERNTIH